LIKNWAHKDIKFKELIDYGFPLPTFTFTNGTSINFEDFDANGLKALNFGRTPPDLPNFNKDLFSLVPEINKKLNYSFFY
jgi:hypothetical protein